MKTVETNEKFVEKSLGYAYKILLSHLLIAKAYQTIYQINAISLAFYPMVRYADYLVKYSLLYMETLEI